MKAAGRENGFLCCLGEASNMALENLGLGRLAGSVCEA